MSDEQHISVTVREDMLAIVKAWPDLAARVSKGGGAAEQRVKGTRPWQVPITIGVVDLMSEVEQWVNFLARVLVDEVTIEITTETTRIPFARTYETHVQPWTPTRYEMPGMLDDIARWRVGHFTAHHDGALALAVADEAHELADKVRAATSETGRRWIPLHITCFEHDTTDQGERVPCTGEYRAPLDPDRPGLVPDMVCDRDAAHRISPIEWQRAGRKSGYDPARIRERLAAVRGSA